jgi:site-specific DNA-methyltransferase (adenine-specific)
MPELTLFHGDCLQVMKEIPDKSVDLIICDLPYGCLTGGGITKKETAEKYGRKGTEGISGCAWDIKINLEDFWKEVRRIRKNEHTPTIHFCTTKFGFELHASNPEEFRYDLVWDKQRGVSFLSANKMPMRSHEMIYIFSKAGAFYERKDIEGDFKATKRTGGAKGSKVYNVSAVYNSSVVHKTDTLSDKRCALTVININNSAKKGNHPTEKPCDLYKFLIERYCPPGGTILDPTFGSGNSVFTAYQMGRNGIGIEKDEKFFEKAVKILEAL